MYIPPYVIGGLLALLFTYAIAYEMRWVALGLGAMTPPGGRHIHPQPVPRLGGLAIFGGALLALLATLPIDQSVALVRETRYVVLAVPYKSLPLPVVGILLGAAAITALGAIDDVRSLPGRVKFPLIYAAASIPVWVGMTTDFITHPVTGAGLPVGGAGKGLTVAWVGALAKAATALSLAVPVLALAVPILDTGYAIVRRYRNGVSIFIPDRGHLHHRLLDRGLSQRQVVFMLWLLSAILGLGGLAAAGISRTPSLIILAVIALFLVVLGWRLGLARLHRLHATELAGPANLP